MLRIDAHHPLWRYDPQEYDWMQGDLALLRRDFLMEDLLHSARQAGVSGTVAVQARQSVEETACLLELAAATPILSGVVGWLPPGERNSPALLDQYREPGALKGLRHVVQSEAPGFLDLRYGYRGRSKAVDRRSASTLFQYGARQLRSGSTYGRNGWPVQCAGCTYPRWWTVLDSWVAPLTPHEQADILGRTAVRV